MPLPWPAKVVPAAPVPVRDSAVRRVMPDWLSSALAGMSFTTKTVTVASGASAGSLPPGT